MDKRGREAILSRVSESDFSDARVYPEVFDGHEPFLDIVVEGSVVPSDILNVLKELTYRPENNRYPSHELPSLRYLGSTSIRINSSNTFNRETTLTFEDVHSK